MELYTIGFTRKTGERFFDLLRSHHVELLVDTRINPDGQLSGFARRADLPFFLSWLADCDYVHRPDLAPTKEMLGAYRADHDSDSYVCRYTALLDQRAIPETLDRATFTDRRCCRLCSEAMPDHCHRRLLAEPFAATWPELEIVHLT